MRYVVFGDVQGNLPALEEFFKWTGRLRKDEYLCLGDIAGGKNAYHINQCIGLVMQNVAVCVNGNHEDDVLEDPDLAHMIHPANAEYIAGLQDSVELDRMVLFHSSLKSRGTRLRTEEQYHEELSHIAEAKPEARVAFHGHTHTKAAFSYDPKANSFSKHQPTTVELDPERRYIFNPGGIGLYWEQATSFLVYDTDDKLVRFEDWDDFKPKSQRAGLAVAFEERWMPNLLPDKARWFMTYAKADAESMERHRIFPDIVEALRGFDSERYFKLGKRRRKQMLDDYSGRLAESVASRADGLYSEFNISEPQDVRGFHLGSVKKEHKGVKLDTPFKTVK